MSSDVTKQFVFAAGWKSHERHTAAERMDFRGALEAIAGWRGDAHPYLLVYRDAGGGYAGLQAIAESVLNSYPREELTGAVQVGDERGESSNFDPSQFMDVEPEAE